MDNQINQQGDLDYACLLYTIANSYKALSGRQIGKKWSQLIDVIPSIHQFFTDGSVFSNKDRVALTGHPR